MKIKIIQKAEFDRVNRSKIEKYNKLKLIADMCRLNTFSMVKLAGSGHLGSSFSAMDIVTTLYSIMNIKDIGINHADRDIFFSSKGHDVPGLYSMFYSLGILEEEQILKLRRLGGLCGHPDVSIQGCEANSGSLGMGISKAKGMAIAKKINNRKGKIFVMTGDGELQEGQIWESLQTAAHQQITNITVIVDHNQIQSDKAVDEIISLKNLEDKFTTFGWHVDRCDGHDIKAIQSCLLKFEKINDKPKILIADTVKGKGISFLEGSECIEQKTLYKWHSGAPDDVSFEKGFEELQNSINMMLQKNQLEVLSLKLVEEREKGRKTLKGAADKIVNAYGQALLDLAASNENFVVIDADLSDDCGLRPFEKEYPQRFIENGIAEQDMVSMAGGIALSGIVPVVNTFGVFLSSRANEQIYNNACENTKIIYVCHYAGLIPAGPGQSHQSIRDISLFKALPGIEIIQPCNPVETKKVLDYCINNAKGNCMIRLNIGPSPRVINLPDNYNFEQGKGTVLTDGDDAVIFAYGPVMLNEALKASELLAGQGVNLKVVNMPWLNIVDNKWIGEVVRDISKIYVLDDHASTGGLGDSILKSLKHNNLLNNRLFHNFSVEGFPAWGTPKEVLNYHGLDSESIAKSISNPENI